VTVTLKHIIQAASGLLVLAALITVIFFAKFVRQQLSVLQQSPEELYTELDAATSEGNALASQAMRQARQLIADGDFSKGHDKLRFLVNFYSDVPFAAEAKATLGGLNLDQLMSAQNPRKKQTYTVQRGDSLARIASQHETTVENIMALNGLLYVNRIQPGQELVVMALNFRTVINASARTLTLFDGPTFIKEYPLLDVIYAGKEPMITTEVERMMAYDGASMIARVSSQYRQHKKLILLKAGTLQVRPVKHPDEDDPGRGFFLSAEDMEEYNLLVRSGSVVEIYL